MSLLHPTAGELADRLVVLQIKIEHCRKNGIPCDHLADERQDVLLAVKRYTPDFNKLVGELRAVHEELWTLVMTDSSPALLAANRRRWAIREAIDKMTGEWKGPEKV